MSVPIRLAAVLILGVSTGGCASPETRKGCEVSCRMLACAIGQPDADVSGCADRCVINLDQGDGCQQATQALGRCGDRLSCSDLASGTCADESTAAGEACDGVDDPDAGVPDAGCTPVTCATDACGLVADGCGGELECGGCNGGMVCSAAVPNVCACDPGHGPLFRVLAYTRDYWDLDADTVLTSLPIPPDTAWDLHMAYGSGPSPARVFHNEAAPSPGIVARGVARVDKLYTQVTSCDVEAAVFSSSLLDLPFDGTNTFLVRTDYGSVFKLGAGTDNTSTIEVSALRLR